MLKRFARGFGLACTLFAVWSCSSDSEETGAPGPAAAGPGAPASPGLEGAPAAGAPGVTAAEGGEAPAGAVTPGESASEGLGAAPLDGAAMGGAGPGSDSAAGAEVAEAPVGEPAGPSPFPAGVTRPKLMIVGDSISAGPGCYKKYLVEDLNAASITSFEFVGQYTDDCGGGVMHSARSCTTALDYTQPTFDLRADCGGGTFPGLATLMETHQPDLLMLQLGVNDVWNGVATEVILANYATLLQQARAVNPNVVLAVAQIHQIRPSMDPNGDAVFARAQALIEAVPAWAQAQSQPTSPVFVADLWTSSDPAQAADGVHPDDAGAQRMAENWFEALRPLLQPE